jgi:hypothetical protein
MREAQVGLRSLQSQHLWFSGRPMRDLSLVFNSLSELISLGQIVSCSRFYFSYERDIVCRNGSSTHTYEPF